MSLNNNKFSSSWNVTGASVRGATHIRNNLPNQDAIDWQSKEENLVLAISDGHGSIKHFRSDIGAKFAVDAAIETVLEEIEVKALTSNMIKKIESRVKNKLPQRIVNKWTAKVKQHYQNNLFSLDQRAKSKLNQIEQSKGKRARKKIENNYLKAYGATLLVVLITKNFSLYLQIGDGDIIVLSKSGVRRVFKEEKFGPATDSLSMSNATNKFKFSLVPFTNHKPIFILLSTDGYINSFTTDRAYLQIVDDFVDLIFNQGIKYIEDNLIGWLKQTTQQGSGDDITLGLICSQKILNKEIKRDKITSRYKGELNESLT